MKGDDGDIFFSEYSSARHKKKNKGSKKNGRGEYQPEPLPPRHQRMMPDMLNMSD